MYKFLLHILKYCALFAIMVNDILAVHAFYIKDWFWFFLYIFYIVILVKACLTADDLIRTEKMYDRLVDELFDELTDKLVDEVVDEISVKLNK